MRVCPLGVYMVYVYLLMQQIPPVSFVPFERLLSVGQWVYDKSRVRLSLKQAPIRALGDICVRHPQAKRSPPFSFVKIGVISVQLHV